MTAIVRFLPHDMRDEGLISETTTYLQKSRKSGVSVAHDRHGRTALLRSIEGIRAGEFAVVAEDFEDGADDVVAVATAGDDIASPQNDRTNHAPVRTALYSKRGVSNSSPGSMRVSHAISSKSVSQE